MWLHSLTLACAAQELARLKLFPEPNAANFVGLTHDLGSLVMEFLQPGILELGCDSAESLTTRIIDRVDSLRAEAAGKILV